jgi:hypothetical protein
MRSRVTLVAFLLAASGQQLATSSTAEAASCTAAASGSKSVLNVGMTCGHRPSIHFYPNKPYGGAAQASSIPAGPQELPTTTFYSIIGGQAYCGGGRAIVTCTLPTTQPVAAAPRPQVTPGVVVTAMRRIGLPALAAHTQPAGKTLVNFATIFYTDPQPFTRTVTLLGRRVTIVATPQTFTWHYGDGTSSSTSTPGARYPAKDVTHNYRDAHRTVLTSVDVSYSARFRVGGGAWQDIPGTVTIAGPTSPLRISEATALLSGDYG